MDSESTPIVVLSSVSGGGKNTVLRRLLERNDRLYAAVTATSRRPRAGEQDGVHYHFLTPEEFRRRIEQGGFIEHAEVHGNLYGVPVSEIDRAHSLGKTLILNIDVQGMTTLKERYGSRIVTIFLLPPDEKTWESRLRQRGTESEEEVQLRLRIGRNELARADQFDHRVINDNLDHCVNQVEDILRSERAI